MKLKLLIFAGLALVLAASAHAYIYELEHQCENSCLQNTGVVFNLTLDPGKWKDAMELQMIQIIDAKKGTMVALFNKSVLVSLKESFFIAANLPNYDGELLINVSPCFTTRIPPEDRIIDGVFIANELTYCEKNNHTMPLLECIYPGSCDEESSCIGNACAELECGDCQYIFDHTCTSYQCCSNETCSTVQQCLNNTCFSVECAEFEYANNHECSMLFCGSDEYVENHSCIKFQAVENSTAETFEANVDQENVQGQADSSTRWFNQIVEFPKKINSSVLYRVLEIVALGAIVVLLLILLEAKTKIFIKLTNRGQK